MIGAITVYIKTILIHYERINSGAAGFIGSQLTHRLWKDGVNVVLVDNYSYGSDDNLIFDDCNLIDKVLKVDIRDRERMDAIFSENVIDYVYNIAGIKNLAWKLAFFYFNTELSILINKISPASKQHFVNYVEP
jgi:UDP-glucose 4-epimerase